MICQGCGISIDKERGKFPFLVRFCYCCLGILDSMKSYYWIEVCLNEFKLKG